jgi:hypothetical protein
MELMMKNVSLLASAAVMVFVATLAHAEYKGEEADSADDAVVYEGEDFAFEDDWSDITAVDDGLIDDMVFIDFPLWDEGEDGANVREEDCETCDFLGTTAMEDGGGQMMEMAAPQVRRAASRDWRALHQTGKRNVCFEADLYIAALCDWQRPFLGDRMP